MNVKLLYVTSALGVAGFASLALALFVFQPVQAVSTPTTPIQPGTATQVGHEPAPRVVRQRRQVQSVAEVEAGLKRLGDLPQRRAARQRVRLIRALPELPGGKQALRRLAREGSDAEKLVAVNVLWARGQRAEARALAQGDRLLAAKVKALERSQLR